MRKVVGFAVAAVLAGGSHAYARRVTRAVFAACVVATAGLGGVAWGSGGSSESGVIAFSALSPVSNYLRAQLFSIAVDGKGRRSLARHPSWLPRFQDAVPSPDGRLVAFFAARAGQFGLFVTRPDGTGLRSLASASGEVQTGFDFATGPVWSPDAKRIAAVVSDTGQVSDLRIDEFALTGAVRTLVKAEAVEPEYSPDGGWLIYGTKVEYNVPRSYYVVPVTGGAPRLLTGCAGSLRWAPDSRRAACNDNGSLAVIDTQTGQSRVFPAPLLGTPTFVWSPDGRTLALQGAHGELDLLDVRTGVLRQVAARSQPLAWSPDGTMLAFSHFGKQLWLLHLSEHKLVKVASEQPDGVFVRVWWRDSTHLTFASIVTQASTAIYTIHPDGSGLRQLTHGLLLNVDPSWSPNGRQLAFTRSDQQRSTVWVMNADGSSQHQITTWKKAVQDKQPVWSPDGTKIAFVRLAGQAQRLVVINANGKAAATVADDPGTNPYDSPYGDPSWSPNSTALAWHDAIYNTDGSGSRPIDPQAFQAWSPTWSPDGSQIVFRSRANVDGAPTLVSSLDINTGTVTGLAANDSPGRASFSPDGKQVAFIRPTQTADAAGLGLVAMPAHGGPEISLYPNFTSYDVDKGPAWSPDGNRIAVIGGDPTRPQRLVIVKNDGSGQRTIPLPGSPNQPTWQHSTR